MSEAAQRATRPEGVGGRPAGAGGPPPGVAGGPPPGVAGGPPPGVTAAGTSSGFEGREADLGKAVALAIRTLQDNVPYQHEMNDALVKQHLTSLHFARDKGLVAEFVEHDIKTMTPILTRMKGAIEKTGNREIALIGMFDRTPCHYQLCLETESAPGRRTFKSPFGLVLGMGKRIGQFDMTEAEVHEAWIKPRILGYAAAMGVKVSVSDIGADGKVTVELVD